VGQEALVVEVFLDFPAVAAEVVLAARAVAQAVAAPARRAIPAVAGALVVPQAREAVAGRRCSRCGAWRAWRGSEPIGFASACTTITPIRR
jgi:hypothetical protein